jgi:hypothetical protein
MAMHETVTTLDEVPLGLAALQTERNPRTAQIVARTNSANKIQYEAWDVSADFYEGGSDRDNDFARACVRWR